MKKRTKNYKNNPLLFAIIFVLAATTIGLISRNLYDAYNQKRTSFSSYIDSCETSAKADESEDDTITTNDVTARTYRFFEANSSSAADALTTLKLSSTGKYIFYVNGCEGMKKYVGDYTETNNAVRLAGEITIDFEKVEDGRTLNFDHAKAGVCHGSGNFSLEELVLEPPTVEEPKEDNQKSPN